MKESHYQQFRWAPHTAGAAEVKLKDYELTGEVEAASPYSAWNELKGGEHPLRIGDLLESPEGKLFICKYVGFEDAHWVVPEPKPVEGDTAQTI